METIGLSFNDMVARQVAEWGRLAGATEEEKRISIANHISRGCSEDEAQFRATITEEIAKINTSILAVIDANNQCILLDLKKAGLLG